MSHLVKISQAVEQGPANCLLLKANQIDSTYKSIDDVKSSNQIILGLMKYHLYWGRHRILSLNILSWDFVRARSRREH